MRVSGISVLACLGAAALQAAPISCGTMASPTACSVQVNGNVEYVFSNFQLVVSNLYTEGDFGISVGSGGGGTGLIEFTKIANTNGTVFLANSNETRNFTLTYDVTVNALVAGTAAFTTPSIVSFGQTSALNSGFASIQMIQTNPPSGKSCQAILNSGGVSQGNCDVLPDNTTDSMTIGNLGGLTGPAPVGPNQNNVSFKSFTNLFSATFTPEDVDPPTGGNVPEPSTWAMLGAGLVVIGFRARAGRK